MSRRLSDEQRKLVAKRIDDARERLNLTKSQLAKQAKCDERTVRNIISGYSAKLDYLKTVWEEVRLTPEELEKLIDSPPIPPGPESAPELMGGYTRKMYEHYLGEYVTIRPKYNDASIVKAYRTRIYWDSSIACYCFEEQNRIDSAYTQQGQIYIPRGSSCMYLMTIDKGWVRTVIVSQMTGGAMEMRGLITSQFNIAGPAFAPVTAPIAYLKISATTNPVFGELTKSDAQYDTYLRILQDTMQSSFARMAVPPTTAPSLNVVPLQSRQGSA